ncbi:hypothetical protein P7C70_g813, partial [Phenoliferia sp. Uapishka_3]
MALPPAFGHRHRTSFPSPTSFTLTPPPSVPQTRPVANQNVKGCSSYSNPTNSSSPQSSFTSSPQASYQYKSQRKTSSPPRKAQRHGPLGLSSLLDKLRSPIVFLLLGMVVFSWRLSGWFSSKIGKAGGENSAGFRLEKSVGTMVKRFKDAEATAQTRGCEVGKTAEPISTPGTTGFNLVATRANGTAMAVSTGKLSTLMRASDEVGLNAQQSQNLADDAERGGLLAN